MRNRRRTLVAVLGLLLVAATACSSNNNGGGGGGTGGSAAPAAAAQSLKGVCPDPVVVQTSWFPEAEMAAPYQLVGPNPQIDKGHKKVTGPLVLGGKDTGVKIEVRAGGPATGYEPTAALMYQDPKITLGMAASDELIQYSAKQPMLAVVTPLEIDPQIIMWDPATHPDWHIIADIGQTDEKVLYFEGNTFMEYLVGTGILKKSQVDGSYDGSPSKFVASGGKVAVQGFATNEPYLYEHEVKAWDKPVAFQLVYDTGYPNYPVVMGIRPDQKDKLAPCLKKLVPMLQQAQVDFMTNPKAALDLIDKVNEEYKGGWVYSRANAEFAVAQMKKLGIVANGDDKTIANFDMNRINKLLQIDKPIFEGQKKPLKPNLSAADIATNEFIDPSISWQGS
jgi:hypothetical protein